MRVGAVVPAYNADWCVGRSIEGLLAAGFAAEDIIVVDDGSVDRTRDVASGLGVQVVQLPANSGPAAARNAGVQVTEADVLLFVDADVVIHPDARSRVMEAFAACDAPDALFGAYDDRPECPNIVSKFRNLLHHFVHLHGPERPHSFWTGCGAVKRSTFERLGGFDSGLRMMEDVEFGLRLTSAGGVVRLDRNLLATHLKCWTLPSMIRMDIFDRAIPWSRLLLFRHGLVNEFNIDVGHRISAVMVFLLLAGLVLSLVNPWALGLSAVGLAGFLALNRSFHALVFRSAGWWTGLAAIPLHIVHVACAMIGLGWTILTEYLPWRLFRRPPPAEIFSPVGKSPPPASDRRP